MSLIIDQLYKKVWITRGCRFNAHERYEKHASLSSFTLLILNVYVLAINLLPLIPTFRTYFPTDETTIFTIILSVLMLGMGQFISSKEFTAKAMRFHDCGKELSLIYDKICLIKFGQTESGTNSVEEIIHDYNLVISKYEANHKDIDLSLFKSNNIRDFPEVGNSFWFKLRTKISCFIQVKLKYTVCILVPPILIVFYVLEK